MSKHTFVMIEGNAPLAVLSFKYAKGKAPEPQEYQDKFKPAYHSLVDRITTVMRSEKCCDQVRVQDVRFVRRDLVLEISGKCLREGQVYSFEFELMLLPVYEGRSKSRPALTVYGQ